MDKVELRSMLLARYPWLSSTDIGPAAVEAGECEQCGAEARLVTTCGPGPTYLGRRCAQSSGAQAWCDGHSDEAEAALDWLDTLPPEADVIARIWWVATGEVRLDPASHPGAVRAIIELSMVAPEW